MSVRACTQSGLMTTDLDPGNHTFSAVGAIGTDDNPVEQDFRPSVEIFADDDEFNDPYFLGAPRPAKASVEYADPLQVHFRRGSLATGAGPTPGRTT